MAHEYLTMLSSGQKTWLVVTVLVVFLIGIVGVLCETDSPSQLDERFSATMSIQVIAAKVGVTGKGLARELGLPLDIAKKKRLDTLGISQEQLDHATAHILSHSSTGLKYYLFAAIVLFGLVYLTRLGRPDNTDISQRKLWYPRIPYITCLLVSVLVCGFLLGKSPNPMEGLVKVFKSMVGLYPSVTSKVLAFVFLVILAIIGNKLICGWACPFGALQELIYSLPIVRRLKRWKMPFWLSNVIRGGLLVIVLLLLFGIIGNRKGFVIYHYLNPFNLFDMDFDRWLIVVTVIVSLALSFFIYRPFCHLICPFGFVSWIAERFSFTRVKIDHKKCTDCGVCMRACPTEAAKDKVASKLFGADCFSCARCLNVCPQDAIRYGSVFTKSL